MPCVHCVQEPAAGETYGTIQGAVRFGDGACIGNGFWMSAHGGSIETALDEATAELVSAVVRVLGHRLSRRPSMCSVCCASMCRHAANLRSLPAGKV